MLLSALQPVSVSDKRFSDALKQATIITAKIKISMQFDPNNNVIKLCAEGMAMEANQKLGKAQELFLQV
jgi:hypothetical protein